MGRFSHEAVGLDPRSGIVYMTEDDFGPRSVPEDPDEEREDDGAFLYRYLPKDRSPRPGALHAGGSLEVLALDARRAEGNADRLSPRQRVGVVWRRVGREDPREDAERTDGAVRFNRLEGAFFAGGTLWFADTAGGEERLGQIFRYHPAGEVLELFYEGTDPGSMQSPDNLVVAPWGDLWFVEDAEDETGESEDFGENRVMGVTPEGYVYPFARLRGAELAGPTFAPDGRTFFFNSLRARMTFAVWGPFMSPSAAGRAAMAVAAAPPARAWRKSASFFDVSRLHGLTALEAAAYESLGVALG
jgi:secreted PhoX family phosphatase